MTSISPEFRHNPLLSLVPDEGDLKDLAGLVPFIEERVSGINMTLEQTNDEKIKRLLVAEREMLFIIADWMGMNMTEDNETM